METEFPMKRFAAVVVVALAAASCGGLRTDGPGSGAGATGPTGPDRDRVEIYSSAFRALAETEGWFDPILLDERICPAAGDVMAETEEPCGETFTEAEQAAILAELDDLANVRFVGDAERVEARIFEGNLEGAGLLTVGEIDGDGDRVQVGGSAYCGGLCGHWMTLVVERGTDGWTVSGTTGPVAIS
jgi:hypothetical protein